MIEQIAFPMAELTKKSSNKTTIIVLSIIGAAALILTFRRKIIGFYDKRFGKSKEPANA
jgi:hypothetical protein